MWEAENAASREVGCSRYCDVYSITAGDKIFTFFMLIIGLGMIAVLTGLIVSAL